MYQVMVGNIGKVYDGPDAREANRLYDEYRKQSEAGYGRAAGQGVTLIDELDIVKEYFGDAEDEEI